MSVTTPDPRQLHINAVRETLDKVEKEPNTLWLLLEFKKAAEELIEFERKSK